jgi:hypothetical protein
VTYPRSRWNRDFRDKSFANETLVNIRVLRDRVESVVAEVQRHAQAGTLRVPLRGGVDELEASFTLHVRPVAPERASEIVIHAGDLTQSPSASGSGTWMPSETTPW